MPPLTPKPIILTPTPTTNIHMHIHNNDNNEHEHIITRPAKDNNAELANYLLSENPNKVIHAMNVLLEASHDFEENFTLGKHGGLVVRAIVIAFERCIGWSSYSSTSATKTSTTTTTSVTKSVDATTSSSSSSSSSRPSSPSNITTTYERENGNNRLYIGKKRKRIPNTQPFVDLEQKYKQVIQHAWDSIQHPDIDEHHHHHNNNNNQNQNNAKDDNSHWDQARLHQWYKYCQDIFSESNTPRLSESNYKRMESLVMIVRNLSFVAANARHLAYNVGTLRMLGGCLYGWKSISLYSSIYSTSSSLGGIAAGAGGADGEEDGGGTSSTSTSSNNNACLHSNQALINLSPYIQVTGSKIFADLLLLDENGQAPNTDVVVVVAPPSTSTSTPAERRAKKKDSNKQQPTEESESISSSNDINVNVNANTIANDNKDNDDNNRTPLPLAYTLGLGGMLIAKRLDATHVEELHTKIPSLLIRSLVWSHICSTLSLFPPILTCITQNKNRAIVLSALELLKEFMEQHPDNRVLFQNIPQVLLQRLVDLLYVPRLGPDALEYLDPVNNMVSRVTALKLGNGYDATIDFELRDRAADLLERITALSPDLKRKVGTSNIPRVFDYLICMLGTSVGRNDARQLAGGVLSNIAMIPENKRLGVAYLEEKLLDLAANDADVANVVCNSLLN